jgi:hypothetical protein
MPASLYNAIMLGSASPFPSLQIEVFPYIAVACAGVGVFILALIAIAFFCSGD